jgi:hypothetical protein
MHGKYDTTYDTIVDSLRCSQYFSRTLFQAAQQLTVTDLVFRGTGAESPQLQITSTELLSSLILQAQNHDQLAFFCFDNHIVLDLALSNI